MKKLFLTAAITTSLTLFEGCKAPPQVVAYKTEGTVIYTVDSAMKIWSDYVNSGHATPDQVYKVHKAYDYYYNSQQIARVALEMYVASTQTENQAKWVIANEEVAKAQAAVINLVQELMK